MMVFVDQEIVPAPAGLRQKWQDLRAALDVVAAAHLKSSEMPLSPFYAHELPGGSEALDKVLKAEKPGTHVSFGQDAMRGLHICIDRKS